MTPSPLLEALLQGLNTQGRGDSSEDRLLVAPCRSPSSSRHSAQSCKAMERRLGLPSTVVGPSTHTRTSCCTSIHGKCSNRPPVLSSSQHTSSMRTTILPQGLQPYFPSQGPNSLRKAFSSSSILLPAPSFGKPFFHPSTSLPDSVPMLRLESGRWLLWRWGWQD